MITFHTTNYLRTEIKEQYNIWPKLVLAGLGLDRVISGLRTMLTLRWSDNKLHHKLQVKWCLKIFTEDGIQELVKI